MQLKLYFFIYLEYSTVMMVSSLGLIVNWIVITIVWCRALNSIWLYSPHVCHINYRAYLLDWDFVTNNQHETIFFKKNIYLITAQGKKTCCFVRSAWIWNKEAVYNIHVCASSLAPLFFKANSFCPQSRRRQELIGNFFFF